MKTKKMTEREKEERYLNLTTAQLNLSDLLVVIMTDIDIFLLKEENQIDDKNVLFTEEDVRNQLSETQKKMIQILTSSGFDMDLPLLGALRLKSLFDNPIISNKEILECRKLMRSINQN